jgi:hypothetical protein
MENMGLESGDNSRRMPRARASLSSHGGMTGIDKRRNEIVD